MFVLMFVIGKFLVIESDVRDIDVCIGKLCVFYCCDLFFVCKF